MVPGSMRCGAPAAALVVLVTGWTGRLAADPRDERPAGAADVPTEAPADERTERARRHFQNGIKLFREADFTGALAEFEAAYRLKPGAASLQNMALCLKELHRYPEAAHALDALLERHGSELTESERQIVNSALGELEGLTATLLVNVSPASAKLTLDGRAVTSVERAQGVRVSVGEHTLAAEAPGYQRAAQVVRLASGERRKAQLSLRVVSGFVSVVTRDPDAAIAIDGTPVAFAKWQGPVTAGEHYVQVYKPGYQPFEKRLTVELGRTEVVATPPLVVEEEPEISSAPPADPGTQRGWYVLGTLGVMGMLDSPRYLKQESENVEGSMIGVRGGYRPYAPIAVEMMIELGKNSVRNACLGDNAAPEEDCQDLDLPVRQERGLTSVDYELGSARIGPNLKLMSTAPALRFVTTLGAGAVFHQLDVTRARGAKEDLQGGKGIDPYFLIEVGAQLNVGHLLLEAAASFYIEGTSSLEEGSQVQYQPAVLKMIGIGARAGFSQWRSPNK
jgi:hypothetical protein